MHKKSDYLVQSTKYIYFVCAKNPELQTEEKRQ